jgi:hypothetical protein
VFSGEVILVQKQKIIIQGATAMEFYFILATISSTIISLVFGQLNRKLKRVRISKALWLLQLVTGISAIIFAVLMLLAHYGKL